MRSLCAADVQFWQPAPLQTAPTEFPHWIVKKILTHIFEEVSVKLKDHVCDVKAPCSALKRDTRDYVPLLTVCKAWGIIVREAVESDDKKSVLKTPSPWDCWFKASIVANSISLDSKYRAHSLIESDSEKSVHVAYDYGGPNGCHDKDQVVIKVSSKLTRHQNEETVYRWLGDADFLPRLHFEGKYLGGAYLGLVLDLLGPDLERFMRRCHHRRFTPKMTLATAIQTVRIYERLHGQGWLHTNAKPGNFAIGPDIPGKRNKIYVFDFEYSNRIGHAPRAGRGDCHGWNPRFRPVGWDLDLAPSRRDDMEGLGYVFSYLERGSHPWQESSSSDELWKIKIATPTKKLFEGMDPVYMQYFDEIKALAWGEIPDYEGILRRFSEVWVRKGYGGAPGEIEWWDELEACLRHCP